MKIAPPIRGRLDRFSSFLVAVFAEVRTLRIADARRTVGSAILIKMGRTWTEPRLGPSDRTDPLVRGEWELLVEEGNWHLSGATSVAWNHEYSTIEKGVSRLVGCLVIDVRFTRGALILTFSNRSVLRVSKFATSGVSDVWVLHRSLIWALSHDSRDRFSLELYR